MPVPEAVTTRYAATIAHLSKRAQLDLLRLWDSLTSWDYADADSFRAAGQPIVRAAAQAALDTSSAYASLYTDGAFSPASPLIVPDAAARLYDPFDRFGHLIAEGSSWVDALDGARSAASALGQGSVYRTARQALADMIPGVLWQRRVSGASCSWCLSRAGAIFNSAGDATFGHDNCDCLAMPVDAIGEHNDKVLAERGFDKSTAKAERVAADNRRSLRSQSKTARKHSEQARLEGLVETDPVRRERLSIREQEWETRAERAEDRLRQLTPAAPAAA